MIKTKKMVTTGFAPLPLPLRGWMREWRNPLRLANIFLASILFGLVAIDIILYLSPVSLDITPPKRSKKTSEAKISLPQLLDRGTNGYQFVLVSEGNVFSPQREDWTPVVPSEKSPSPGPRKDLAANPQAARFTLCGVVIINNEVKRALISKGGQKTSKESATVYVKEGDDLEGFRVKKIEDSEVILESEGSEIALRVFKEPAPLSPEMIMPTPMPAQATVPVTPPTRPGNKGKGHDVPQGEKGIQTEQVEQSAELLGSEAVTEEAPSDEELGWLEEALESVQGDDEVKAVLEKAIESLKEKRSKGP